MNNEAVAAKGRSMAVPEAIVALSVHLLRVEHRAIQALMFLLSALILLNVVTRYTGYPIYWIDESAVYSVVWLTFIGASAMTRMRLDFAVTMLTERFSERGAAIFRVIATLGVVLFGIALGVMCWLWLDPVGIAQAGFDAKEYAGQSFNFIYTERTQTLNWPTWVIYLIMPIFALSMTLHALANLFEDLGLVAKQELPGFAANADGVVN
ncbi:TRAP-type C4-dicarboxylate transport system, small permease component [Bosea sp. 62]|uniref:TRAP transporter small permease n=1 Tax=unclassified Bosea (in: a-proteobacteria) TaxID=2653178 RepID=UPI0012549691|nr:MULTISPECIES: TRAP transporter small permease [unclassified Bosea (in: a-proteobacteria)]CAD5290835.1 TRAP-type C4-dicarboxylate transport system, small permease component [Bosea sp. 7B]CAD5299966.1 TRAP-type C4-dicarboxylate transport system, small permease component [Bosea sp. 21B]CAD5300514.1 TRAP-type C4-dicarboxylate transport system, small permease component [Bosea sp. 46]VVT61814.1 TRAP-type C4-dicarboxylate transport system, small permease component [Bosea sp. EC-HK365B]VXB01870.1 T